MDKNSQNLAPNYHLVNYKDENKLDEYKHGDLVILTNPDTNESEKEILKNSQIKIVNCDNTDCKTLVDLCKTPNELLCIPISFSSSLKTINDLNTYGKLFKQLRKYKNMYKAIELDTSIHSNILKIFSGNRSISNKRKLYYFFVDPDEPNMNIEKPFNGVFIWHDNPNNLDVNDDKRFIQVTPNIDDVDIGEQVLYDRDNEVIDFSKKFKDIYDNTFESYLKNLKENTSLYGSLVPKNPKEEEKNSNLLNSQTNVLFYFKTLEFNNDNKEIIDFVVVRTFDKSEEYKFFKKICTQYGPYQNTYLWCTMYNIGRENDTENTEYFLDLPSYLYRLLDE